jgi:hypothetical protein
LETNTPAAKQIKARFIVFSIKNDRRILLQFSCCKLTTYIGNAPPSMMVDRRFLSPYPHACNGRVNAPLFCSSAKIVIKISSHFGDKSPSCH